MTPEREYLLVTEFFDGAVEIGEAEVDDDIIDQGLQLVRRLWDAGLAHRDIKPANLLVRDGELLVIDVAFVQVRPSPWRQAVDLANMMLVLAVRTDAERVYERALQFFTPDEIAEAFAAARGVASPPNCAVMKKRTVGTSSPSSASWRRPPPDLPPAVERQARLLAGGVLLGGHPGAPGPREIVPPPNWAGNDDAELRDGNDDDPHGAVGTHGRRRSRA